jgi:hypothetical protein
MINKPHISSDVSKLQYTPKFTDNQRIADPDICIFVCIFVHICVYSFHVCYTWFGAYPNHEHIKIIVKEQAVREKKEKKTAQIGTNVRARVFNARLLARSQFASGRSCDRQTQSRISLVSLGPRANAELVPKFYLALYASHAALPMVTLKNVALHKHDFDF